MTKEDTEGFVAFVVAQLKGGSFHDIMEAFVLRFKEAEEMHVMQQRQLLSDPHYREIRLRLSPCPHCGGTSRGKKATVYFGGPPKNSVHNFKIKCYGCGSEMEQSDIEKLISSWNARS